ncbi:hypothetical protein BEP19_15690 [Ammoniphilus oxalaticus]|uniref:Prohead serine protease domain-containing protein n=1 Tax=Ammoniphilus oxalaticus TaxID=66863 RepID=A0A419SDE6_9BACL|nr:HK97 family phage prohead protease [Ammoniphilus oxalaticus]RKD21115.1 hypothetical protein BEP19_15690 [Ammoniphilus oxalaticus]
MKKRKYIYGLAMPFDDAYHKFDGSANTLIFERTNKASVTLWTEVVATIDHDYDKTIGNSNDNLKLVIHDRGLFFRLEPNSRQGYEAYGKVSRGELDRCSVTYLRLMSNDVEQQERSNELAKSLGWDESIIVKKHDDVLVEEICLTKYPANENTFCTTNRQDPRLKGVVF